MGPWPRNQNRKTTHVKTNPKIKNKKEHQNLVAATALCKKCFNVCGSYAEILLTGSTQKLKSPKKQCLGRWCLTLRYVEQCYSTIIPPYSFGGGVKTNESGKRCRAMPCRKENTHSPCVIHWERLPQERAISRKSAEAAGWTQVGVD